MKSVKLGTGLPVLGFPVSPHMRGHRLLGVHIVVLYAVSNIDDSNESGERPSAMNRSKSKS